MCRETESNLFICSSRSMWVGWSGSGFRRKVKTMSSHQRKVVGPLPTVLTCCRQQSYIHYGQYSGQTTHTPQAGFHYNPSFQRSRVNSWNMSEIGLMLSDGD